MGDRERYRPDLLLFLTLHDLVKGMVSIGAVLLTGIAGDTIREHTRVFPVKDVISLLHGRIQIKVHILAFHQTINCLAFCANLFIISKFMHEILLLFPS
jgi:hypothetical protein